MVNRRNKTMRGGSSGATQYGNSLFPGGSIGQLDYTAANNLPAAANQLQPATAQVGGKGKSKRGANTKRGGTILVDIAVPAALVYSNQMYSRKNSNLYSSHKNKSYKRKNNKRRSSRRK